MNAPTNGTTGATRFRRMMRSSLTTRNSVHRRMPDSSHRDGEEDRGPADRIHRLRPERVGDQDPGFREGREERRVDREDDEQRDEAPDGAERTEEGGEEVIQGGHPPPQATREMRTIVTSKIKVRPFTGLL